MFAGEAIPKTKRRPSLNYTKTRQKLQQIKSDPKLKKREKKNESKNNRNDFRLHSFAICSIQGTNLDKKSIYKTLLRLPVDSDK